jgi:hypothetical protein
MGSGIFAFISLAGFVGQTSPLGDVHDILFARVEGFAFFRSMYRRQ